MTNKEKYILLCEHEKIPLHAQAWWMEAVSHGKRWDSIVVESKEDGHILAAMPYHISHRFGIRRILMPVHTQYSSIYLAPDAPSNIEKLFAEQLDHTCKNERVLWCYLQGFYPTNIRKELHNYGFVVNQRVTYCIHHIHSNEEELLNIFSQNKRRQLRKAKELRITELSAETFYRFHSNCLKQRGKRIDYSEQWAKNVINEALNRKQGVVLSAYYKNDEIAAAVFLAWDAKTCYYLLPTYNYNYKDSGAMAWLTKEAILLAHNKGLSFDFEGSMTPSIASSYKQFGGMPTHYFSVEKYYIPLPKTIIRWINNR